MLAQLSVVLEVFSPDSVVDPRAVVDFMLAAEAAGVDRLALSDHVAFGERLEAYGDPKVGGSEGGVQPTGPDGAWLEPLTTIAYLAARTSRVRFATYILIAALRRPVVLAKVAATIDVLSGGRLDLGVGVGWQREEYEAAGLAFEGRGRLLDHTVEVCQTLWGTAAAHYESGELSFAAVHQMPKPLQPGGVPLWVSGTVNARSMDRLARYGVGWIPWGKDAVHVREGIERMRSAMVARGRDPEAIGVVAPLPLVVGHDGSPDARRTMAAVPELVDAGVTDIRLRVSPGGDRASSTDCLAELVAAFHAGAA